MDVSSLPQLNTPTAMETDLTTELSPGGSVLVTPVTSSVQGSLSTHSEEPSSVPLAARTARAEAIPNEAFLTLVEDENGFHVPEHTGDGVCIVHLPELKTRKALHKFQKKYCHVDDSAVHNMGVYLKDRSVRKNQVVGFFNGNQIRARHLTPEEVALASGETSDETAPALRINWVNSDDNPIFFSRMPHFVASCEQIFYEDANGVRVHPGINALDTPYPLANLNIALTADSANVRLILCTTPEWVATTTADSIRLKPSLPWDAFRLLVVADRDIDAGEELLIKQITPSNTQNSSSALVAKHYLYPQTCSQAVSLKSAAGEGTVVLFRDDEQGDNGVAALMPVLLAALTSGKHSREIVSLLNGQYMNPLNRSTVWTLGDLQYWADLMGIRLPEEGYDCLTYICHCIRESDTIDNHGKNYLEAWVKTHLPDSIRLEEPPASLAHLEGFQYLLLDELLSRLTDPDLTEEKRGSVLQQLEYGHQSLQQYRLYRDKKALPISGTRKRLLDKVTRTFDEQFESVEDETEPSPAKRKKISAGQSRKKSSAAASRTRSRRQARKGFVPSTRPESPSSRTVSSRRKLIATGAEAISGQQLPFDLLLAASGKYAADDERYQKACIDYFRKGVSPPGAKASRMKEHECLLPIPTAGAIKNDAGSDWQSGHVVYLLWKSEKDSSKRQELIRSRAQLLPMLRSLKANHKDYEKIIVEHLMDELGITEAGRYPATKEINEKIRTLSNDFSRSHSSSKDINAQQPIELPDRLIPLLSTPRWGASVIRKLLELNGILIESSEEVTVKSYGTLGEISKHQVGSDAFDAALMAYLETKKHKDSGQIDFRAAARYYLGRVSRGSVAPIELPEIPGTKPEARNFTQIALTLWVIWKTNGFQKVSLDDLKSHTIYAALRLISSPEEQESIWKSLFTCLAFQHPEDSDFREHLRRKKDVPMLNGFELTTMHERRDELPTVQFSDFEVTARGEKKML